MNSRLLPTALALFLAGVGATATACKASFEEPTVLLPAADTADAGLPFNKDEVVPSASFTDFTALGADDIQGFIERTPYDGTSFLETYQSNGVLFSTAVFQAAQTYRINPIVLLVAVETKGGLLALSSYPQPFAAVDYLFGCGCAVPTVTSTCEAASAGLDVQLACYANALRTSLDAIDGTGETAGGWAPGKASTTVDGITVTPKDDSTAALYQYDPVVGQGRSGSSLFANVWDAYTQYLMYEPPEGEGRGATARVGDPCVAASDCAVAMPICANGSEYPGGMCTSECTGSCPGVDTFCAEFSAGGFCLTLCNPTDPASCRTGYACALINPFEAPTGTLAANVCRPP